MYFVANCAPKNIVTTLLFIIKTDGNSDLVYVLVLFCSAVPLFFWQSLPVTFKGDCLSITTPLKLWGAQRGEARGLHLKLKESYSSCLTMRTWQVLFIEKEGKENAL